MTQSPFPAVAAQPDLAAQEHRTLDFWRERSIFSKLRAQNAGKPHWSFVDGPITANNPMGVHHAWGRTYKDLFIRFKAMQGFDQRWQNLLVEQRNPFAAARVLVRLRRGFFAEQEAVSVVGKTIVHYEILEPLGAGEMGDVYVRITKEGDRVKENAWNEQVRKAVAVKVCNCLSMPSNIGRRFPYEIFVAGITPDLFDSGFRNIKPLQFFAG